MLSASIRAVGLRGNSLPPSTRVLAAIANPMPLPSAEKRSLALEARANLARDRYILASLGTVHMPYMGLQKPGCHQQAHKNRNSINGIEAFLGLCHRIRIKTARNSTEAHFTIFLYIIFNICGDIDLALRHDRNHIIIYVNVFLCHRKDVLMSFKNWSTAVPKSIPEKSGEASAPATPMPEGELAPAGAKPAIK